MSRLLHRRLPKRVCEDALQKNLGLRLFFAHTGTFLARPLAHLPLAPYNPPSAPLGADYHVAALTFLPSLYFTRFT